MRRSPTPAERILWNALHRNEWGFSFRRQHPIGPYIADIVCLEAKLIVEVDGDIHALSERQEHDAARDGYLTMRGYRVVRYKNADVFTELPRVLEEIKRLLTE
jgi:ATP-dependent DNA helicase RecQ